MTKITTAFWKGAKHGITSGLAAAAATASTGALNPKQIAVSFVVGALAGIGINVKAIKNA